MAMIDQTSSELVSLFDESVRTKAHQIYQAIPGTVTKYLETRKIIKKVKFRKDLTGAEIQLGTKKDVNFVDFERSMRKAIHESFELGEITEIRAEDISAEISKRYQTQAPSRAGAGKRTPVSIRFNSTFQKKEGDFWTNVTVYVYAFIEEECEHYLIKKDKRKISYELTIDLNGIAVSLCKAIKFCEMIAEADVEETIKYFNENYKVTWDEI
jgi:hypothetical protein